MTVSITDARAKIAAVLAPINDYDPEVHSFRPDAVVPPCIMVEWRTPMVDWITQTRCLAFGHLGLTLVGGRLDVDESMTQIELMYDTVQRRLRDDNAGWSLRPDEGILPLDIGNVMHLACRLEVTVPLAI